MTLSEAQWSEVTRTIETASTVREAAMQLRSQLPGLKALVVDAMDMRHETAALTLGARRVYLAATDGHCWTVTTDPGQTGALILTEG